MTLIEKLQDLHAQATNERSHYYTASVIREAIEEINQLNEELARLKFDNEHTRS